MEARRRKEEEERRKQDEIDRKNAVTISRIYINTSVLPIISLCSNRTISDVSVYDFDVMLMSLLIG